MTDEGRETYEKRLGEVAKNLTDAGLTSAEWRVAIRKLLQTPYEVAADISAVSDLLLSEHGWGSTLQLAPENCGALAGMWGLARPAIELRTHTDPAGENALVAWMTTGGGSIYCLGEAAPAQQLRHDKIVVWESARRETAIGMLSGRPEKRKRIEVFIPSAAALLGRPGLDLYTKQREEGIGPIRAALSVGEILGKQGEVAAGMQNWKEATGKAPGKERGYGY